MAHTLAKVYLCRVKSDYVVHAMRPKYKSMGSGLLDRMFGGGFYPLCDVPPETHTMSVDPEDADYVTCDFCRAKLEDEGVIFGEAPYSFPDFLYFEDELEGQDHDL